jgi:hypothetical protein
MGWNMLTVKSRTMHTDEIIECLNWCNKNMHYYVVMSNKEYHVGGTHNTLRENTIAGKFIERIRSTMEHGYINAWDKDKNKLLQFKLTWG